jgi:hypothetical protein
MRQHAHNHDGLLVGNPAEDASQRLAVGCAFGGVIELYELHLRFRHSSPHPITIRRVPEAHNRAFLRGFITYHHIAANKMFVPDLVEKTMKIGVSGASGQLG